MSKGYIVAGIGTALVVAGAGYWLYRRMSTSSKETVLNDTSDAVSEEESAPHTSIPSKNYVSGIDETGHVIAFQIGQAMAVDAEIPNQFWAALMDSCSLQARALSGSSLRDDSSVVTAARNNILLSRFDVIIDTALAHGATEAKIISMTPSYSCAGFAGSLDKLMRNHIEASGLIDMDGYEVKLPDNIKPITSDTAIHVMGTDGKYYTHPVEKREVSWEDLVNAPAPFRKESSS